MDGRKGGLSAKTIQNQHMLLKDFFAYAMRKYHLPCNPTLDTTRPEVITPEMRVLSPSEMQVFIEEVMRETQRVAILTTLFVGFRVGEVLALKISDLDLEKQTLSVTKNLNPYCTQMGLRRACGAFLSPLRWSAERRTTTPVPSSKEGD